MKMHCHSTGRDCLQVMFYHLSKGIRRNYDLVLSCRSDNHQEY